MNNTFEFNDRTRKIMRHTIIRTLSTVLEETFSNKQIGKLFPEVIAYAGIATEEIERSILANAEIVKVRDGVEEENVVSAADHEEEQAIEEFLNNERKDSRQNVTSKSVARRIASIKSKSVIKKRK